MTNLSNYTAGSQDLNLKRQIATSTWSDALDRLGIPNQVMSGLMSRGHESRAVGPAIPVEEVLLDFSSENIALFTLDQVFAEARPASVLVFGMGGSCISTLGGLASTYAHRMGLEAVIIDGACRDAEEIRRSGLRVWSRHVTPTSGRGRIRIVGTGSPVVCGEVRVAPGDFIIADGTGIVVVPAEALSDVSRVAAELHERDAAFFDGIEAGESFGEVAKRLGHF